MKKICNYINKPSLNIFLGLALLSFSCKRDKEIAPQNINSNGSISDCENIPPFQQVGSGYNYTIEGESYNFPEFNPNNNDEFLITKDDSIFIFSRLSNQKVFAFKFPFWNKISWSRKNWLIMNGLDQKVYKIKPNGDSLTILINSVGNFYPIWNNNGTMFCAQNSTINKTIIYNDNGLALDTINISNHPSSDWDSHNKIIWGLTTLNFYDLNTHANHSLFSLASGTGSFNGYFWLNSNEIICSYTYGIFKTNILNNSTVTLKQTCNSNVYSYPTFDSTLNKIIWKKQLQTLINDYNVKVVNKIVITDINCTNETEINLH